MYKVTKRFKFEAAHRLHHAYNEDCKDNIHGHSYKVDVTIGHHELNEDNMVVDFKQLKDHLWDIFAPYDHALVLHKDDAIVVGQRKLILYKRNPTAEVMAETFWHKVREAYPQLDFVEIKVWETEDSYATYSAQ